jgi:peptide/nickel transport system permease protein
LLAAIAISGLLGASTGSMVLALILLSWMKYCRLTRSLTIAICQQDFIVQVRLNKLPVYLILWRHVLVNIRLPVIVLFTRSWSKTIWAISGLSFLGFGVQPPNAEWGAMLLDGKLYMQSASHVMIFPGIAILISVLSINLIGD